MDAPFTKGTPGSESRLTSIQYNTQYAGYIAGLYAIDYIETNKATLDGVDVPATTGANAVPAHKKYQAATYGGIGYTSVTS